MRTFLLFCFFVSGISLVKAQIPNPWNPPEPIEVQMPTYSVTKTKEKSLLKVWVLKNQYQVAFSKKKKTFKTIKDLEDFLDRNLKNINKSKKIVMFADKEIPSKEINQVMGILEKYNIAKFHFVFLEH